MCIRIHGCYIIFHLWGESIALALERIRVSSSAYGYETYCLFHFLLPKFEKKKKTLEGIANLNISSDTVNEDWLLSTPKNAHHLYENTFFHHIRSENSINQVNKKQKPI